MEKGFLRAALSLAVMGGMLSACGGGEHVTVGTSVAQSQGSDPLPTTFPSTAAGAVRDRPNAARTMTWDQENVFPEIHTATWAYFYDPTQTRWYIAEAHGRPTNTYSLGQPINRRESWWEVGSLSSIVSNQQRTITTKPNLQSLFSTDWFYALSGNEQKTITDQGPAIRSDRTKIQGSTVPVLWYFFRAPNNGWFIVNTETWRDPATQNVDVRRFAMDPTGNQYDWQDLGAETTKVTFLPVSSGMQVRFRPRFGWPTLLPTGTTLNSEPSKLYKSGFEHLEDTKGAYTTCSGTADQQVKYHPGVDINVAGTSGNADENTPIRAIADGFVTDVHTGDGALVIRHSYRKVRNMSDGQTVWSSYRHMSGISVAKGDFVRRGDTIGLMGRVGGAEYAHLHMEIRNERHPDPDNARFWCGYAAKDKSVLGSWLEDPVAYIRNPTNH